MGFKEEVTSQFPVFEHEPLPSPTSIRLARLDTTNPRPTTADGQILLSYKVETVDLDDDPSFDALSYTWGYPFQTTPAPHFPNTSAEKLRAEYSPQSRHPILVNGCIHYIHRNLHDALVRLSAPASDPQLGVDRRYRRYGKTHLIEAAEEGETSDVLRLIREGADLNAQDAFGETAMHYAVWRKFPDVVRALLRAGANWRVRNKAGNSVLDTAEDEVRKPGLQVGRRIVELIKNPPEVEKVEIEEQRYRAIWIDQIAIDQTNIAERNAQVAIMGQIFAKADTVIVRLGIEDQFTDFARWQMYVGWARYYWREVASVHAKLKEVAELRWSRREAELTKAQRDVVQEVEALNALVTRAWFNRVCLARSVKVLCGPYEFSWPAIFTVAQRAYSNTATPEYQRLPLFADKGTPQIKYYMGNRGTEARAVTTIRLRTNKNAFERYHIRDAARVSAKAAARWQTKFSLPILLSLTWGLRATDPRDKVLALLSVAASSEIKADYSRSVRDVFISAAHPLIRGSGDDVMQDFRTKHEEGIEPLESLSLVQDGEIFRDLDVKSGDEQPRQRRSDLPSWVPDFSLPFTTTRIFNRRFMACTDMQPVIRGHGSVFETSAWRLDTIYAVPGSPTFDMPDCKGFHFDFAAWVEAVRSLPFEYPETGEPGATVLRRTLMMDDVGRSRVEGEKAAEKSFYNFLVGDNNNDAGQAQERNYDILNRAESSVPATPAYVAVNVVSYHEEHNGNFRLSWAPRFKSRRLFVSEGGRLGVGPNAVEESDEVWLIAGARTPFILRPRGSSDGGLKRFKLVGEAYVHGIMYGETAVWRKADDFEAIELV